MGTWGAGIFDDDISSDLRDDFKTRIGEGETAEAATAAMIAEWGSSFDKDPDLKATFWLALASTQWGLGRLLPSVRDEALKIIESGEDGTRWAENKKLHIERKKVLERLRRQLVSEQPLPKKVRKQFRQSNDWPVGSIRRYTLHTGEFCLFRVIGHATDKGGTSPVLEPLDWVGNEIPDEAAVNRLPVRRCRNRHGGVISQFLLGAVSEREFKAIRIADTGIISQPEQKPHWSHCFLGRNLDKDLDTYFVFGRRS